MATFFPVPVAEYLDSLERVVDLCGLTEEKKKKLKIKCVVIFFFCLLRRRSGTGAFSWARPPEHITPVHDNQ